jgi:hypothetical protein
MNVEGISMLSKQVPLNKYQGKNRKLAKFAMLLCNAEHMLWLKMISEKRLKRNWADWQRHERFSKLKQGKKKKTPRQHDETFRTCVMRHYHLCCSSGYV